VGGPCEVRTIVMPTYTPDAETQVIPISRAEAAMHLATNALNLPFYGSRAIPLIAGVVRRSRSYRLVFGSLADGVRAVSELTSAVAAE